MLMLPGGVAGLLFSYVLVFIFRNALLVPGSIFWGRAGMSSSRRGCCSICRSSRTPSGFASH